MKEVMIDKKIVITGQSGFIGKNLYRMWGNASNVVPVRFSNTQIDQIPVTRGDIILHLAGIAHQNKVDPQLYYDINYKKAVAFAKIVKQKGASHFVFVSTTKVYGDNIKGIIKEDTQCNPTDDYGKSKLLAENEILQLQDDRFIVSIVRPPLVYGAGVKGNMLKLLQFCSSGKPLPFKGVKNERSIVYVGNLLAMVQQIIIKKRGGIFIPSDDKPLSTFHILRLMKQLFGTRNIEIPVPSFIVSIISTISPTISKKVFGSLIFDNTVSNQSLQFKNPYSTEQGFGDMVRWYKTEYKKDK